MSNESADNTKNENNQHPERLKDDTIEIFLEEIDNNPVESMVALHKRMFPEVKIDFSESYDLASSIKAPAILEKDGKVTVRTHYPEGFSEKLTNFIHLESANPEYDYDQIQKQFAEMVFAQIKGILSEIESRQKKDATSDWIQHYFDTEGKMAVSSEEFHLIREFFEYTDNQIQKERALFYGEREPNETAPYGPFKTDDTLEPKNEIVGSMWDIARAAYIVEMMHRCYKSGEYFGNFALPFNLDPTGRLGEIDVNGVKLKNKRYVDPNNVTTISPIPPATPISLN